VFGGGERARSSACEFSFIWCGGGENVLGVCCVCFASRDESRPTGGGEDGNEVGSMVRGGGMAIEEKGSAGVEVVGGW
jgi:hypothetical protein